MGVNFPIQYTRVNKQPLTDQEVFASLSAAQYYNSNGASYAGQLIAVRTDNIPDFYVVGEDKQLHKFETGSGAASIAIQWPLYKQMMDEGMLDPHQDYYVEGDPADVGGGDTSIALNVAYVSSLYGDDDIGNGSQSSPYLTIGKAYENISENGVLYCEGTFTSIPSIGKSITIVGIGSNRTTTINGNFPIYTMDSTAKITVILQNLAITSFTINSMQVGPTFNVRLTDCSVTSITYSRSAAIKFYNSTVGQRAINGTNVITSYYENCTFTSDENCTVGFLGSSAEYNNCHYFKPGIYGGNILIYNNCTISDIDGQAMSSNSTAATYGDLTFNNCRFVNKDGTPSHVDLVTNPVKLKTVDISYDPTTCLLSWYKNGSNHVTIPSDEMDTSNIGPKVVQTTGESTVDVMSQNAVSTALDGKVSKTTPYKVVCTKTGVSLTLNSTTNPTSVAGVAVGSVSGQASTIWPNFNNKTLQMRVSATTTTAPNGSNGMAFITGPMTVTSGGSNIYNFNIPFTLIAPYNGSAGPLIADVTITLEWSV